MLISKTCFRYLAYFIISIRTKKIPSASPGLARYYLNFLDYFYCQKIWETGQWPTQWAQSSMITVPKKGNLQRCNNYRTISLISHPSKVMLRIILNRLRPQAEKIIAEEQAGFRTGRSTTEQIYIQPQDSVREISST